MAKGKPMVNTTATAVEPEDVEIDESLLTEAPEDWEFDTVTDETPTRIVMDTVGDRFIGEYLGMEHVTPPDGGEEFDMFVFRGRDGNLYSLNTSYKLKNAFEDIAEGVWVRVTFVKEIPVKKGNPMKDYKVDVKR